MLGGSLTNALMGIQNVLLVTKNFCRFESDYGAANTIVSVVTAKCIYVTCTLGP